MSYQHSCVTAFAIFLGVMLVVTNTRIVEADEVPAFFLKIAKNIPRVGRSGRFEDYFLKTAKHIPRIGKRGGFTVSNDNIGDDMNDLNEPMKRMMNIPSVAIDDPSWAHFPLAIEGPPELWRTLAAYTNRKNGFGSDDIDNEIWQRDKRTETGGLQNVN